jgi:hypothetical protein
MTMENPRLGLVLLRVGGIGCGEIRGVLEGMERGTAEIRAVLERHFQVSGPWVVDSTETLAECAAGLQAADLDLVVVAYQTVAEDRLLLALLDAVGMNAGGDLPLVVWCYLPWSRPPRLIENEDVFLCSGAVGTFGALGALRNRSARYFFTYGAADDPRLVHDLVVAGRAARVRRALRSARFGVIAAADRPGLPERSTFVDEARLRAELGPRVVHLGLDEASQAAAEVSPAQASAYLTALKARYPLKDVAEADLRASAALALGLERLAREHGLDLLALDGSALACTEEDGGEALWLRPGLYPEVLQPGERLYLSEDDLGAASAALALHLLTGSPAMLLELWFWDAAKNLVIGGHAGLQDPRMAHKDQAWVSPDMDYCRPADCAGVQMQFIAHPGRVTLFQLRSTPGGWQAVAASGICLEGLPWTETCPHAVVRLDAHIDQFLKRAAAVGVTQHWVMAYGSVLPELEALCQMYGIALEVMEAT